MSGADPVPLTPAGGPPAPGEEPAPDGALPGPPPGPAQPPAPAGPIRAAGVVVLRTGRDGPEVLLVHRPRHQDWSLPKGKVDPGEHVVAAAVRECVEESGVVPILGPPLPTQSYPVLGVPKQVDYWAAGIAEDRGFCPGAEIDEIRWVGLHRAGELLSYDRDLRLAEVAAGLPGTVPLILLRHAQALKRPDYHGHDDGKRPLTEEGRAQAEHLVALLAAFGIRRVHSSDAVRCRETVHPYARLIGVRVHDEPALSEHGHEKHPRAAVRRLLTLAGHPEPIVVCSHRPVLPDLTAALATLPGLDDDDPVLDHHLPPGGFVVVHRAFGPEGGVRAIAAERHLLAPGP